MKKSILITGANRGIGLAFVKQYLQNSWLVIATCRNPGNAMELKYLQQQYGEDLKIYPLELCDDKQIKYLKNQLANRPIDILMQNAGKFGPSGIHFGHAESEPWINIMHTNAIGPMLLSQALIDNILLGHDKIIAFISSRMGSISDNTSGGRYYYRTSKAALNCIVKNMSIDLADQGITTLALNPGWVQTSMGGIDASFTPQEAVTKLKFILDKVSLKDSGKFYSHDGTEIDW